MLTRARTRKLRVCRSGNFSRTCKVWIFFEKKLKRTQELFTGMRRKLCQTSIFHSIFVEVKCTRDYISTKPMIHNCNDWLSGPKNLISSSILQSILVWNVKDELNLVHACTISRSKSIVDNITQHKWKAHETVGLDQKKKLTWHLQLLAITRLTKKSSNCLTLYLKTMVLPTLAMTGTRLAIPVNKSACSFLLSSAKSIEIGFKKN